MNHQNLW